MGIVIVTSATDIASVLRGERERREWTGEDLDARVGWPDRYAAKAENPEAKWGRRLIRIHGMADLWLQSLDLHLCLVERKQAERMMAEAAADPEVREEGANHRVGRVQVSRLVWPA